MKITLSKSQWQRIGKTAGWLKKAQVEMSDIFEVLETDEDGNPLAVGINMGKLKALLPFGEGFSQEDIKTTQYARGYPPSSPDDPEWYSSIILCPTEEAWGGIDVRQMQSAKTILEELKGRYPEILEYIDIDVYNNRITIKFQDEIEVEG